MKYLEILESLCIYDKRNPDWDEEGTKKENCYCDNCFHGKTELAEEILKLKG